MAYPNEKRKNRAGVEAFGSGKPPQPVTTGALTNRRSGRVGGVKSRRQQPAQQDNFDIDAIFRGARESRGMVRRGMSGAQLNPDGSDPGSGFNQFMKNNPHLDTREKRQNQYAMENQQRMNNIRQQGPAAVDFAKQTKGYTDANGQFIPPTMPSEISSPYGSGSVSFPNKPTGGTMKDHMGRTVPMSEYLPEQSRVQDTKYGAMPGQEDGGALTRPRVTPSPSNLSSIDQIFPGQSSPPGDGAGSGLVGAGSALGAPGGDSPVNNVNPYVIPGHAAGRVSTFGAGKRPTAAADQLFSNGMAPSGYLGRNPNQEMYTRIGYEGATDGFNPYFPSAQNTMPQGSASNPYASDPFGMFGQQAPAPRYDFIDPQTGAPMQGTLMEKELMRRANEGILPKMYNNAVDHLSGAGDWLSELWSSLSGRSVETPAYRQKSTYLPYVPPQAPQPLPLELFDTSPVPYTPALQPQMKRFPSDPRNF